MRSEITGRILVVDDQDNWREALASLLTKEGHTVQTLARFEEAVEVISRDTFDLVILDVRLVDTDVFNVQGLELLRIVKAQKTAPKVIILTGYPESIRIGVLEYGADALVLKVPLGSRFDSDSFKGQVQRLLKKARAK
jgi:DNA-binding response OmpR family regulator